METAGYRIKLYQPLVMPIMFAGAPRRFAILNGTFAAALVLGLHIFYLLPIFIILHLVAVVLAKRDPYFFDIMLRHFRKKSYYNV